MEILLGGPCKIYFRLDCNFSCLTSFDIFFYHVEMQSKELQCWINFDEEIDLDVHDCANTRQQISLELDSSQQHNSYGYVSYNRTVLRDNGNYSLKFISGIFEFTSFVYLHILGNWHHCNLEFTCFALTKVTHYCYNEILNKMRIVNLLTHFCYFNFNYHGDLLFKTNHNVKVYIMIAAKNPSIECMCY